MVVVDQDFAERWAERFVDRCLAASKKVVDRVEARLRGLERGPGDRLHYYTLVCFRSDLARPGHLGHLAVRRAQVDLAEARLVG